MRKEVWLDAAQVFDTWRVVPRGVLLGYCYWVEHITNRILTWYEHLPGAERTLEASGLAGAIITAVTGLAVWVFKVYSENGNDWTQGQTVTTTVSTHDARMDTRQPDPR